MIDRRDIMDRSGELSLQAQVVEKDYVLGWANANCLWINLFATSLKGPDGDHPGGRAALVMANSASDARHSEADIRQTLIENNRGPQSLLHR